MSAWLADTAAAWWQWMTASSLQVALVFALAAAVDAVLGARAWPRVRAALWLCVPIGLCVPPRLVASVAPAPAWSNEIAADGSSPWIGAAFLVWALVAAAAGSALAWHCRALRAGATHSVRVPARVRSAAARAARRVGLLRVPHLVCTDDRGPAVLGVLRPTVVIPRRLTARRARTELEHALLHELMHVRRRDPLWALLCAVAQVVWWFHPLLWIARRRLVRLRELGCDQDVVRLLGDASGYRRTLLREARIAMLPGSAPPPRSSLASAFVRARSGLLGRIHALDRPARRSPRVQRVTAAAVCGAVLGCGLPVTTEPRALVPPQLSELRGCLQLRFAVQHLLAQEAKHSNDD